MSRQCYVCGKKPGFGHKVSHSNIKTKRRWLPNLQKIKILIKGKPERVYVCTKCIKKKAVKKAV